MGACGRRGVRAPHRPALGSQGWNLSPQTVSLSVLLPHSPGFPSPFPPPQAPLSPPFPGSFPRAGPSCRRARGNRNLAPPDWGEGGGKTFLRPRPLPQAPGAGSVGRACCASSLRRCVGLGGKGGTHPLPPPFLAGEPAGQPYRGPMVAVAFVRPAARPWAGYPPPNPRPGGGNPKPRTGRNHHPAPHPVHLHRQAHRW